MCPSRAAPAAAGLYRGGREDDTAPLAGLEAWRQVICGPVQVNSGRAGISFRLKRQRDMPGSSGA